MYNVSTEVRDAIRQSNRKYKWAGTISCKDGTQYDFGMQDMIKSNSGSITRKVSGGTGLELGSVCAAELDLNLILDVSRYILYGAVIGLTFLQQTGAFNTWDTYSEYSWADLSEKTWGEIGEGIYIGIPMGVFNIAEVTRTANRLQIVAYDNMLKFDTDLSPDSTARYPYDWLQLACEACDVELGMTIQEVRALPNGTRRLALASAVVEDCNTYRDLIRYLSAALCSVAQIDRSGKLVLLPYGTDPVLTFPASWRYSSQFSDFQAYYTGLYATYKAGGLSEYFHSTGEDDGLIYNIGVNPFLQASRDNSRHAMAQKIIDRLSVLRYAPYSAEVPCDPTLDPMDVISFTGRTATENDLGAITEIVCRINGKMTVKCAGENPLLNDAKSRYTKNIEGLLSGETYSSGGVGSSDFWMVYDDNSDGAQTIGQTPVVVCSLNITPKTDHTKSQVNFTVTYTLDEDSAVLADVQGDSVSIYSVEDDQTAGNHTLTVTCGKIWDDQDDHEIRILLSAEPIIVEEEDTDTEDEQGDTGTDTEEGQ